MTTLNEIAIGQYYLNAKSLGCPRAQIDNGLKGGYIAFPRQLAFHSAARLADEPGGPDQIGFGGARGPGKSHAILAQLGLDDCQRREGLQCLYIRKIGKQAREQMEQLRVKVLRRVEHGFNRNEGLITFPNGSRIVIGHFKSESDIDNYLGLEYDVIAIEESTTLSSTKYRALRDSNRTSRTDWRPRIYNSTNPGGVGHAWYKQTFIEPFRRRDETYTRFIPATVTDNPLIDPGYKRRLEENTGWRLRAYRYGDWDIAAGQFFTTWRREVHVKPPPSDHRNANYSQVWAALDYGLTHYTAAYLLDQVGETIYVLDEYLARGTLIESNAQGIHDMLARHGLSAENLWTFVAGPDAFSRRHDGSTIARQYRQHGIRLKPANADRVNGAAAVMELIGDVERGIEPRLYVSPRCHALIECLPGLEHDPARPEDVLKVDTDEDGVGGDDPYDALRYGIMAVYRPKLLTTSVDFYGSGPAQVEAPAPARSEPEIEKLLAEQEAII